MDLSVLKQDIRTLEKVFGNSHERFRVKAVSLDELTCTFITQNGRNHEIMGNITSTYPQTPPIWFAHGDFEETTIISNALEMLSTTTGSGNHIFSQVKLLLNVLCPEFGLPEPINDLEMLAPEIEVDAGLGSSSGSINSTPHSNSTPSSSASSFTDYRSANECPDAMELDQKVDEDDGDDDEGLHFDFGICDEDSPSTSTSTQPKPHNKAKQYDCVPSLESNRLIKELRQIFRSESYKRGSYTIELNDENLHECSVRVKRSAFVPNLVCLDDTDDKDYILLNLTFNNYPVEPPIVRVVYPTIVGNCVLSGGSISIDKLTKTGWKSEYTLEAIILEVSAVVVSSESKLGFDTDRVAWAIAKEGEVGSVAPNFLKAFSPVLVKNLAESECMDVVKPTALVSLPYSINLLEEMDYKFMVLQVLSDKSPSNRFMSELRIVLFAAAALDPNREKCLQPFPACFYDPIGKCSQFDKLYSHASSLPSFEKIKEDTNLPSLTWQLLHWILTNPLSLEPLIDAIPETMAELKRNTGLELPVPDNVNTFMFNIVRTKPKKQFLVARENHGSAFAFHGSPIRNFHSIIHRGLISALNVRSAYGVGTYLSSDLKVSRTYSFGGSNLNMYCVAVCEVINAPNLKRPHDSYFVCSEDDYMQLSHIYLFKPNGCQQPT